MVALKEAAPKLIDSGQMKISREVTKEGPVVKFSSGSTNGSFGVNKEDRCLYVEVNLAGEPKSLKFNLTENLRVPIVKGDSDKIRGIKEQINNAISENPELDMAVSGLAKRAPVWYASPLPYGTHHV